MAPEASPETPTDRAGFLLSRVGTAVQSGFKDVLAGWDLRPLHFLILSALGYRSGSSQQDLCRMLGIDSGNMVELLDTLEARGYARRAPHARDRRRHVVSITPSGRTTLARIGGAVDEYDRQFLAPLGPDERRQLVELLGKLYAPTKEARGGGWVVATSTEPRDP
jgi:DNA-binding MarR family transcriptional regulator